MKFPLIAVSNGDVEFYHSFDEIESYIEPIDVKNHEYQFFDCEGFVLLPIICKKGNIFTIEYVELTKTNMKKEEQLKDILLRFLSNMGFEAFSFKNEKVEELVSITHQKFKSKSK